MRPFLMLLFIMIFPLLSILEAQENDRLMPNNKYHNITGNVVYIIYELPPEEEFENKTKYTFRIVKHQELKRFNFQVRLQNEIDSLSSSIRFKESSLDSLNEKYEVMKK